MIDINRIRQNTQEVHDALLKRGKDFDFAPLLANDAARRELIAQTEALKKQRNDLSKSVPQLKKAGQDTTALFARVRAATVTEPRKVLANFRARYARDA